jgi:hypothetical protein
MEVVQIGDVTLVKMLGQSLIRLPTFGTENRNPNHRYAMQPIVLKSSMQTVSGLFQRTKTNLPTERKLGNLDVLEVLLNLY